MRLFVGNLPYTASEDELTKLFSQFGAVVSCKIVLDRETNRSRGFGFVEMTNSKEAEKAIKDLDGTDFKDRALVVKEAQERESRPPRQFNKSRPPRRSY